MTQNDSEVGQGLLTVTPRCPTTEPSRAAKNEAIHILCVEVGALPDADRAALSISREEQLSWLTSAAERGRSLVVLHSDDTVEFYTTDEDRLVALRPALKTFAAKVRSQPGLGKTRTVEQTGAGAARHLLKYAAELASSAPGTARSASEIHGAAALSAASTSLGSTLASLFRAAANVGRRVRQETSLNNPKSSPALRELEAFAAERIVEEELATWQAQEAEIQRANDELPDSQKPHLPPFASREPASEVRLRVGTSITPRISYLLEPKRASS